MDSDQVDSTPPLPPGFKLDASPTSTPTPAKESGSGSGSGVPALPPGFKLDPVKRNPTKQDLQPFKPEPGSTSVPYEDIRRVALPAIGATAGGYLAGPVGAAAGGFLGSDVEQGVERYNHEPEAPKSSGEFLKRAGIEGLEQGAVEFGGSLITKGLEKTIGRYFKPENLYQSALKPTGTLEKNAIKPVQTGLKEGIPAAESSRGIVGGRIDQLGQSVERMIQSAPTDIPASSYVKNIQGKFDALRKQWGADATKGPEFVSQLNDMERDFLVSHGNPAPITKQVMVPSPSGVVGANGKVAMVPQTITIQPADMTLAELRLQARPLNTGNAQAIKKQTYETIRTANGSAWDAGKHPALSTRANKEISRGIKEELEAVYPGIKSLNARQGALIGLEEQLERFTKREMNRQVTSMGLFGAGGAAVAGHFMGHSVGNESMGLTAGLLVRRALEDPAIKSRIAIALDAAARQPGATTAAKIAKKINLPAAALRSFDGSINYQENKQQNP